MTSQWLLLQSDMYGASWSALCCCCFSFSVSLLIGSRGLTCGLSANFFCITPYQSMTLDSVVQVWTHSSIYKDQAHPYESLSQTCLLWPVGLRAKVDEAWWWFYKFKCSRFLFFFLPKSRTIIYFHLDLSDFLYVHYALSSPHSIIHNRFPQLVNSCPRGLWVVTQCFAKCQQLLDLKPEFIQHAQMQMYLHIFVAHALTFKAKKKRLDRGREKYWLILKLWGFSHLL